MEELVKSFFDLVLKNYKEAREISPWDILEDKSITDVSAMQNMSASYYRLMIALGAVGVLTSLMVIGIKVMWAKSSQSRRARKEELMFKVLIGIAIFSYLSLIGMLYGAVTKLA